MLRILRVKLAAQCTWHLLVYQGYEQTSEWISECGEKLLEGFKHRRTMISVFKNLLCVEHELRGVIKTRGGASQHQREQTGWVRPGANWRRQALSEEQAHSVSWDQVEMWPKG